MNLVIETKADSHIRDYEGTEDPSWIVLPLTTVVLADLRELRSLWRQISGENRTKQGYLKEVTYVYPYFQVYGYDLVKSDGYREIEKGGANQSFYLIKEQPDMEPEQVQRRRISVNGTGFNFSFCPIDDKESLFVNKDDLFFNSLDSWGDEPEEQLRSTKRNLIELTNENRQHPEGTKKEVFLGNFTEEDWSHVGWKTKRRGKIAYRADGSMLLDQCLFSGFAAREEVETLIRKL